LVAIVAETFVFQETMFLLMTREKIFLTVLGTGQSLWKNKN